MADDKLLSDNETWERLQAAIDALGDTDGATIGSKTALKTAKQMLIMLQLALLGAEQVTMDAAIALGERGPLQP